MFNNEYCFDSYRCPPPLNITNNPRKGICSEYRLQKDDSYCAAYCLYSLYLTQNFGFKNAVSNLY